MRLIWRHHLIVAENDSKRLPQDDVKEPEEYIVRVARDVPFQLSLQEHARHIDKHQRKGDEVVNREDTHDNVLVKDGTHRECNQTGNCRVELVPPTRIVNVADEVVVNGLVPLFPILLQIARVPPVRIKTTVRKKCQFCPKVEVAMEQCIKNGEPHVGARHAHMQCCEQYFDLVSLLEVHNGFFRNW